MTRGSRFILWRCTLLHNKENNLTWARLKSVATNFVFGGRKAFLWSSGAKIKSDLFLDVIFLR